MNPLPPETLIGVATKWRTIRSHYPGWVVAPDKCREQLWEYTNHWIDPVFGTIELLDPGNALFVLYELNWRLEIALCPLLLSQTEKIVKLLDAVDKLIAEAAGKIALNGPAKEQITSLSFAVLRETREDLDSKRFDIWTNRVLNLIQNDATSLSRWHYEQCLFNLNLLKHQKVEQALLRWSPNTELPFWESKRASILAELGNFKEAAEIAENALEIIRSRLRPFVTDYTLLSQEGLVMSLLRALRLQIRIQQRQGDLKEENQDSLRWNQLETYGCNPWTERRVLELAVSAPPPKWRVGKETIRGFDPGHLTVSSHYVSHDYFYDYRPGFALLRFFEEGGIPLRCGTVNTSGDCIAKAATWIEPFAPSWALGSNFRADDEKAIKQTFDRVRVATLTPKEVDTIFTMLMDAVQEGIGAFASGNMHDSSFVSRLVPLICELLSRMAFRVDAEKLQALMNFSLALYAIRSRSFETHDCLSHLMFRIIDAADRIQIEDWIPTLIALPIPAEGGFEINEYARRWPEPADYIKWERLGPLQFDGAEWLKKAIDNLIRVARDGAPLARKHAISRLTGLYKANLLNTRESTAFGKAIWSQLDQKRGLPENTPYLSFSFLNLPSPHPSTVIKRLRDWLLSPVPESVTVSQSPDSSQQPTFGGGFASQYFFNNLRGASRRVWARPRGSERSIQWTSNTLKSLLNNFVKWLSHEKPFVSQFPEIRSEFEELKSVLSQVVLPRLSEKDSQALDLVEMIIKDLNEADVPALAVLVGLKKNGRDQTGLEERILIALKDQKTEHLLDAFEATFMWCFFFRNSPSSSSCLRLTRALISRLLVLNEPCLADSIRSVRDILEYFPEIVTPSEIELLAIALDHLLAETALNESVETRFAPPKVMAIARGDKPIMRTLSAYLASVVASLCERLGLPLPESVQSWKLACQNDPLPEVRKAWLTKID
jgi:hypothetical protein